MTRDLGIPTLLERPDILSSAVLCAELGFGFVELLSGCPTNWHMDPITANKRIAEAMIPVFPLGVCKDVTAAQEASHE